MSQIVDLNSFRRKKEAEQEIVRGRPSVYQSQNPKNESLAGRMNKIQTKIDKINNLIKNLKNLGKKL